MTAVDATASNLTNQQLGLFFQYTIEAYKTFQKLAENLPKRVATAHKSNKVIRCAGRTPDTRIRIKVLSASNTSAVGRVPR